jgi:DNA-binding MarR family transcriptional regulator
MQLTSRLSNFLPYQLSTASNAVSGRIALEYRTRFGLSVPEWRVMAVLGDSGQLTQRDLTRRTLMDKVAVNRACRVLEERGLAARQPNETDGRSHLLDLTESGRTMHGQIMPLATEMERRIFESFSEGEVAMFRSILEKVRHTADEISDEHLSEFNFGIE